MTSFYYINPSTQTVVDVLSSAALTFPTTGMLPVRVDPGVGVHDNPTNLDDLLTAKTDGLIAKYPGHYAAVLDPCLSTAQTPTVPGLDTGTSLRVYPGNGFTNHVVLGSGVLVSLPFILPYTPSSVTFIWELYTISVSETSGRYTRDLTIVPNDGVDFTANITFGGAYQLVTSGVSTLVTEQGDNFSVTFTNNETFPLYLGSWTLLLGPETEIIS